MGSYKFAEPLTIKGMTLRNRFVMPGMGSLFGDSETNMVSPRFKGYIEARARGGMGLITVEYTAISPEGRAAVQEFGLWDDRFIPGFKEVTDIAHQYGAKISIQLHHCGSATTAAACGSQPVAPTANIGYKDMPRELTVEEIHELVKKFGEAAARAKKAGFDAVEIHAAHGYLISQFMSPMTNLRQDEYGGSFENRMRFPLEVIHAVREAVGEDFPISLRFSAEEHAEGGRTLEDALKEAPLFEKAGIDMLNVSCGFLGRSAQWIITPGYQEPGFLASSSRKIKEAVNIPVCVVGKIHDPETADNILKQGDADLVAIGRAAIVDPNFPNKAIDGCWDQIRHCIHCLSGCYCEPVRCAQNPEVGQEWLDRVKPAVHAKRVVVVGAGPAGLEAAIVCAKRGHRVTLVEKNEKTGGQIYAAAAPPWKQGMEDVVRYRNIQAEALGVNICLGKEATAKSIAAMKPEAVIIATGSVERKLNIPGADQMVMATDVLTGASLTGKKVLIIGGGSVGCETAHKLLEEGKEVVIVEMMGAVANDMPFGEKSFILPMLENKAQIYTNSSIVAVNGKDVILKKDGKEETLIEIDTVINASGRLPDKSLEDLHEVLAGIPILKIGDAISPSRIMDAVTTGYEAALTI